nr:MAG TPA: hypothetical protein [Caudoviricetes sp.]
MVPTCWQIIFAAEGAGEMGSSPMGHTETFFSFHNVAINIYS